MAKNYHWGSLILDSIKIFIDSDLNKSDYLIFFLLCSEVNIETNIVNLNQRNIRRKLSEEFDYSIHKGTISKSINKLLDQQLICKSQRRQGFMVNPEIFYLGGEVYLKEKRQAFRENLQSGGEPQKFHLNYSNRFEYLDSQEDISDEYEEL